MTNLNELSNETKVTNFLSRLTTDQQNGLLIAYFDENPGDEVLTTVDDFISSFKEASEAEIAMNLKYVSESDRFNVNDTWVYQGIYYGDLISGASPLKVVPLEAQNDIFDSIVTALEYGTDDDSEVQAYTDATGLTLKDLQRYMMKSAYDLKKEL